ncbi:hypothetical protein [Paeniglutamicibacter sp.]|uniref:hypothetical protein n=1 Tax=Paeniglutamicibacter sp. TaxID=1934391 RepID=UPI00398988A5
MGEDHPALGPVDHPPGFGRTEPAEVGLVHDGAVRGRDREQVRDVGRRVGADEFQVDVGDPGEVGGRVLSGIEHHDRLGAVAASGDVGEFAVPGSQGIDHQRELGDVRLVSRIGVGQQRNVAIAGDHPSEADQAQVGAFLLGLASLGDRRFVVGGIDVGGEVGHDQRQGGNIQVEFGDRRQRDAFLDHRDLLQRRVVGGFPEPAVIQHRWGILVKRSAAVVFHQSLKPAFEMGATTRFNDAKDR